MCEKYDDQIGYYGTLCVTSVSLLKSGVLKLVNSDLVVKIIEFWLQNKFLHKHLNFS